MIGQMMQQPLLISSLIVHAQRHHGAREIVSRRVQGDIHRTTYTAIAARSRQVAKVLAALGAIQFQADRGQLSYVQHRTCALPQRVADGAVSPSTIDLKQASTIVEIRS